MTSSSLLERDETPTSTLSETGLDSTPGQIRDFYDLTRTELAAVLGEMFTVPGYKAIQLFQWVYRRGVNDFSQMTDISGYLRKELARVFTFSSAQIVERQISLDGSRKYLLKIGPGHEDLVEAVMIKQPTRMTLCVSSQIGCGMGCKFCRTATMGFRKNLSAAQIIGQVVAVMTDAKQFDDSFTNIVFMGMGEPLHNFDGVTRAIQILLDHNGLSIAGRKITVSSVGLVPAIKRFGELNLDANLAISLNATTDLVRNQIMPINKAFPLATLLSTLRNYPLRTRRVLTMEYVMLNGVNDTPEDLQRLPKLLKGIKSKVNLIPYNENAGLGFKSPTREWILRWQSELNRQGVDATIRWSKGQDIAAACGQLASLAAN